MSVEKKPENWIHSNRKEFINLIDETFKYNSINEDSKISCSKCDDDESCEIEVKKFPV